MAKRFKKEVFQKPDYKIGSRFNYNGLDAIIKKIEKDKITFSAAEATYHIGRSYFEDLVREGSI